MTITPKKRRVEIINGKAVFHGAMTCEAIRAKVEQFEALVGGLPIIKVAAPTVTSRSVMSGQAVAFNEPRRVVSIHRLFIRLDMTGGRTLDLIPEQVPDLVVELHLVH